MRNKQPVPITDEARENYMINLAMDLVEKRLIEGTATSQETTHFLKLGSTEARVRKRILEQEEELTKAKTDNLRMQENMERLISDAIDAMKSYAGSDGGYNENLY